MRNEERVLLLAWEMPPFVAGGSWTATYHLVRKFVSSGVPVTVATPWDKALLSELPFGTDVPIECFGMSTDAATSESGGPYPGGPYPGGPYPGGPYPGGPYPGGPYPGGPYPGGPYPGGPYPGGPYPGGPYPGGPYHGWGSGHIDRSMAMNSTAPTGNYQPVQLLISEFTRRLLCHHWPFSTRYVHAIDWITCEPARKLAKRQGVDWIAHLHSTEHERNEHQPSEWIVEIERRAATRAALVVVPSAVTASRLNEQLGSFETPLLIFPIPSPSMVVLPLRAAPSHLEQRSSSAASPSRRAPNCLLPWLNTSRVVIRPLLFVSSALVTLRDVCRRWTM